MLTSDKDAEPKIVKFPIKPNETEREWRLDDGDEPPIVEKEWKLDDSDNDDNNPAPPSTDDNVAENNSPSIDDAALNTTQSETASSQNDDNVSPINAPKKSYWKVYLALLGAAGLSVWFSHQSINAYWQQTYHKASPLEPLNHFALWQLGAKTQNAVNHLLSASSEPNDAATHTPHTDTTSHNTPPATLEQTTQNTENNINKQAESISHAVSEPASPTSNQEERVVWLNSGDKVLFVGDSIMQGIAPHVQRRLKSEYQIDSVNLSKQSTGLAYPKFFDWPSTIEKSLQNDPNIKLIVVLLGANDPWDFPNPQGGAYLKFQSPEWNQEYLNRVNRIIQTAEKNQTRIIWLGVPYMRRSDLDKGVRHLNQILGNELVNKSPTVIWLPTDMLLSDGQSYQDSMMIDGERVRIRTKDGIHLNTAGQTFMSNYLNSYIKSK